MTNLKLSLFRDGYQNVYSTEEIEDWNEFVDLVIVPQVGSKNGSYLVRGFCDGPRADENIRFPCLIIIDGDQLLDNGHTCSPPQPVHEVMVRTGITHVIYSSFSNDLANNRHKWRLCLPCPDVVDQDSLRQGVEEVISLLHENGINIRNVKENNVLSQPWFLPRCPDEGRLLDFYYAYHDGAPWKLTGNVIPSAESGFVSKDSAGSEAGHFSMEYVIEQFQQGTLHQGIKSLAGWYCRTTDWKDSQIKAHLTPIIRATCKDIEKVTRACEGQEIDKLITYCRQKSGVTTYCAGWKDTLISAADLQNKKFPPVRWAVDDIVPEGLTILAGDPKVGKSLLAVDICSSIASGNEVFGAKSCTKGVAVYLSMEDPERRVKERIERQCDMWPDTFKLVTGGVWQLGKTFFDTLDEMLMLWPDLRSVVIDTMQFVMPEKKSGTQDYQFYHAYLHPVHNWAINNHIALIMITHLTKGKGAEGENPFSDIIGSTAIQGTADAMILLKKNHAKAGLLKEDPSIHDGTLIVTGREIARTDIKLIFEGVALKWMFAEEQLPMTGGDGTQIMRVSAEMSKKKITQKQLAAICNIHILSVRTACNRLKKNGIADKDENGEWFLVGHSYAKNGW